MAPNSEDEQDQSSGYSLAKDRTRREKRGSKASARAQLLAKIKSAKETGQKFVQEEENDDLYELVDEDEYSDIVNKRKEDNWIIEDGTGYVEDGRDLFDEEHEEGEEAGPSRKSKGAKKKNPNIKKPGAAPNLTSMFAAGASRAKPKPKQDISKHDDILEELLATAEGPGSASPSVSASPAIKLGVKRKQPLPLFTRKPAAKPSIKNEIQESGYDSISDSLKSDISSQERPSQTQSQMSGPLVVPESSEDFVIPSSQNESQRSAGDPSMEVDHFDDDFDDDVLMEIASAKPEKKIKNEIDMTNSWMVNEEEHKPAVALPSSDSTASSSSTGLPTVTHLDSGEEVFRFYWLDAYEDYFKHPGTVYLFGKTESASGQYVSCCVAVKNIYRQVFLLPRQHKYNTRSKTLTDETVAFLDVYNEFNDEVAPRYRIKNYKSRPNKKQYSFELSDVPSSAEYLEVRYGCEHPSLPKDLYGETFSHVFGTNKSSLELFLLEQKIKGPCWLDIKQPKTGSHSMSWCKFEVLVEDFKTVSVSSEGEKLPAPPLVTLTMSVKSAHNSKSNQNEVVQVACLINSEYYVDKPAPEKLFHTHFLAVTKTSDLVFPLDLAEKAQSEGGHLKMEVLASERALLGFLLAKIHKYDPDVLIGHDISNFELDFLLNRVASNKVPHWHKISRLKRSGDIPRRFMGKSSQIDRSATCGRIICDTMISARELIRAKSYDLSELVSQLLRQKREEVEMEQMKEAYSNTEELLKVSNLTIQDAFYAHKLMFELNILPLAWQITTICGNVLSRTLLGGRSERNEYLLLHAFSEKDFVVPDKSYGFNKDKNKSKASGSADLDMDDEDSAAAQPSTKGKRKPAYAGGLVLEPKKGFYDTFILLLDFNSLYPSIIQEYNVCFTTVNRSAETEAADDQLAIPEIPDSGLSPGILPVEIRKLVQSRKQVKNLMKEKGISKEQYMQYDIRQKALKLTANSMYGCLGFTYSRFYAKPLAALITAKGREILQKTKDLVEKMGLDVIYGDTDSIMINTNSRNFEEVFKLGNKVKAEVNKAYRLLEIDIDGVYKSMLLLKKKKYAALNVSKGPDGQCVTNQELKGLDIVRRDWCDLSKQTGLYVVNEILSGESKESILENIHGKLREVKEAVHSGDIPMDLYYITKQLTKAPEAYPDKKSLPHVQVALRLNTSSAKKLRAGDTVYYIVCKDGSSLPASQRAYHPEELSRNDKLKVDTEYYLAHQIHPVVSRLCDPIEGTDSALIAEMLGLDSSRYQHKVHVDEDDEEAHARLLSEEEKYKLCSRLEIVCQHKNCGRKNIIDSPFRPGQDKDFFPCWENCSSLNKDGTPHKLQLSTLDNESAQSDRVNNNISLLKNKISTSLRTHVNQYYQGWLACDDSACNHRTRRVPLQLHRGRPICPTCTKTALVQEYTESMLYDQLCFYKYIFDISKRPKSAKPWGTDMQGMYAEMSKFMDAKLDSSAYGHIDLHKLFSRIVLPGSVFTSSRG